MANKDGTLSFDTKIDSSGFEKGISTLGSVTTKAMGTAVTGITALGGAAIKVGSDFEAGMSQVQAVSGASGEELERLKEKAKEMGASTKFSATESAEALNYMAMAGWKTEEMLGGIEGIMNLAAASGEDLATTSDIVTDAMTAFGMEAKEAGDFADILAVASSNANTNVGMMGETFKYVAPIAGAMKYSAEDTAFAIGLMANSGIKASQAGTALRSVITRLSTDAGASSQSLGALGTLTEKLGVEFYDAEGNARDLKDVLLESREAWKGLTLEQQANYAKVIAGQEAESAWLAIMNATTDDVNKLTSSLENANGAAAEMAEIMQDNLQGQLVILQSGLEGLGVSLYETMQDTAKDVVKEAQGMVQQLQDAFNEGGFDGLVSEVGNVLSQILERVASSAPELIAMAVSLVHSFCEGVKSSDGIGEAGASLIMALAEGIISMSGDLISTAGVLILQLVEGIASSLPALIEQAAVIISDFALALVDNLPIFVDVALQLVMGLVQGFIDAMPVLLEGAIQLFMAILEALPVVIEQLLQALPDLIIAITDYFTENTPMIVEGAVRMLMGIIEAIPKIIVALAENLPEIINAITISMIQAIPTIFAAAKDLFGQIIEAIPEIVTSLKDAVPDIIAGIVNGLVGGVTDVKNAALELGSSILGGIKSFFGINSPSTVMAEQGDFLVQGLINGIANMPAELAQYLDETVGRILAWGQQIYADVQSAVQNMVDIAVSLISLLPDKMWAWLVNAVTRVVAWGQQILSSAKMAVSNMISAIISQMLQLPGKVAGELAKVTSAMVQWGADIVSRMTEVGRNIVSGIWNGISSGWDWLTGKVADLANSLLESAKGALGINSPSTEFRDEFGRWLMPGAVEGVKRSMPRALQDMKAQAGELLSAMKGTVDAAMGKVTLNASGMAGAMALTSAGTVVYNDNHQEQENNYHVAVATPAETNKAQREAFRKFAGGVK